MRFEISMTKLQSTSERSLQSEKNEVTNDVNEMKNESSALNNLLPLVYF